MSKVAILITLIFMNVSGFSKDTTFSEKSGLSAIEDRIETIEHEIASLKVAKDYFSSILNSQTAIFSLIVVVAIAVGWGLSYLRVKIIVRKEFDKKMEELTTWKTYVKKEIVEDIDTRFDAVRDAYISMGAKMDRAFSVISKEYPGVSFFHLLCVADKYHEINESELVRICLNAAHDVIQKVHQRSDISEKMDEINEMIASIDVQKYKIELELIRSDIERIYKSGSHLANTGNN